MARWRLSTSHYLTVEGNEWEYNETDRASGKQLRKRLPVPMLLEINDPNCWNVTYRNPRGEVINGEIIVAYRTGTELSDDIIFTGTPTPDMIPLDDEAKDISASYEKTWKAAPDEEMSYGQKIVERNLDAMAEAKSKEQTVKIEGLSEIMTTMTEMMKMNQAMMANLIAAQSQPQPRRA